MKKLGSIGDVNPVEFGGGYVLENPTGLWVEHFDGLDCDDEAWQIDLDNPEHLKREVTVYRVDLEATAEEFLDQHDWVSWASVAATCGTEELGLYTAGDLQTPQERALAIQDAAGHYGWYEFDQYPLTMTLGELIKRWEGL